MGPNVERIRSGSTRVIRGHMPLEVRRELMAAVKAMLSLDEDNHQRHAGDDDVCYEVRKAREAVAKALGHNAGGNSAGTALSCQSGEPKANES